MSDYTKKQLDTMFAAIESRLNATDRRVDELDERVAAHTEGINLLRGDAQRWKDSMGVSSKFNTQVTPFQSPVGEASLSRKAADAAAKEKLAREGRTTAAEAAQQVIQPAA